MITKVLRSKYPSASGNEIFELPVKRAFHHLDWMNRGWLAPTEVEQLYLAGASKLHWVLRSSTIARIVRMEDDRDSNPDHHINLQEFINIVLAAREEMLTTTTAESSKHGLRNAASALKSWYASSDGKKMLSGHWSLQHRYRLKPGYLKPPRSMTSISESPYERFMTYTHEFSGDIPETSCPLEPNITNAVYLATKYCMSEVNMAFANWRAGLRECAAEDRDEVTGALNNVLEVCVKFHFLESNHGLDAFHWIDQLVETALIAPLSLFEDMESCPLESILSMRMSCWSLLRHIIGFVNDLWIPRRHEGSLTLPNIPIWRKLRMLDRSRIISKMASVLTDASSALEVAQTWYSQHKSLSIYGRECVRYARLLRQDQEGNIHSDEIHIDNVKISKIPHTPFRKPSPATP